jgi:hypothetical protein
MEIEHTMGMHGAVRALEEACQHYADTYPQAGVVWKKPAPLSFEVGVSFQGTKAEILGEVGANKVTLSLEVPDGTPVPEAILKMFIRKEATKWLG